MPFSTSALSPSAIYFICRGENAHQIEAEKMATEIVAISGNGDNIDAIKEVLEDSLAFSQSLKH
jgi:hypothetical protein